MVSWDCLCISQLPSGNRSLVGWPVPLMEGLLPVVSESLRKQRNEGPREQQEWDTITTSRPRGKEKKKKCSWSLVWVEALKKGQLSGKCRRTCLLPERPSWKVRKGRRNVPSFPTSTLKKYCDIIHIKFHITQNSSFYSIQFSGFSIVTRLYNITIIQFQNIFITPKRNPISISSHCPLSSFSKLWQVLIYFSVSMDLSMLDTSSKKEKYVAFCVFLLSFSVMFSSSSIL